MSQQRKPLVTHIFTADPSAHVFNGKIYIYPSHDIPHNGEDNDEGDEYLMEDYHVLSMDSVESPCVDNGEALHMRDVKWVSKQMWAPDLAYTNGKYHLIFPARDKKSSSALWKGSSFARGRSFTSSAKCFFTMRLASKRYKRESSGKRPNTAESTSEVISPPKAAASSFWTHAKSFSRVSLSSIIFSF